MQGVRRDARLERAVSCLEKHHGSTAPLREKLHIEMANGKKGREFAANAAQRAINPPMMVAEMGAATCTSNMGLRVPWPKCEQELRVAAELRGVRQTALKEGYSPHHRRGTQLPEGPPMER